MSTDDLNVQTLADRDPVPLLPLAHFRVSTDGMGRGTCEVNGHDLSNQVRRAALLINPGEPTSLQLELRGAGDIEGDGIVKVLLDDTQAEVPLAQAVLAFLNSVDPVDLERRVMMSGMNDGPVTAVLAALRGLALQ